MFAKYFDFYITVSLEATLSSYPTWCLSATAAVAVTECPITPSVGQTESFTTLRATLDARRDINLIRKRYFDTHRQITEC